MRTLLVMVLVGAAYAVVYYRLLVKFYDEKQNNVRESGFAAIFSLPPYATLPEKGRRYARRYWIALAVLVTTVIVLALANDLPARAQRAFS